VREARPVSPRAAAAQPLAGDDDGGERECRQLLRDHIDDTDAAIRAFEALRGRRPNAPCAHKQLGIFYKRAGQDRSALDAWRRYLELRPDAPDRSAIQGKVDALEQRLGGR
jgi:regulator of sirC expression with transglutaminase-like and TPR domain